MRARANGRLLGAALACGTAFDIAARRGLTTIAATMAVVVVAGALLLSGRLGGRASRLLVGAAPSLAVILTFRTNPWVTVPAGLAIALLLVLGVSFGADGSGIRATFPTLCCRLAVVMGHLALAPGMLRARGAEKAPKRGAALARGVMLGGPVVVAIGLLLASADPIFRSWFDLAAVLQHLALTMIGSWVVLGLLRAASAQKPSPELPAAPSLGTVEAACVLSGLCALYATFVIAQFVALSSGGQHVLATHGLTYAEYARRGFFQLLACTALTLVVLLSVRACANPSHPVLAGLSELTVLLTMGVVLVAIRRLQLYEGAYGLTMLRLGSLVSAVWIGVVFLLLGVDIARRGSSSRWYPAAVLLSGFITVAAWGASNPAAIVAQTNLSRAQHGQRFDVDQALSLGADALPTIVTDLRHLDPGPAAELRLAICGRTPRRGPGSAFNGSLSSARQAVERVCGQSG